MTNKLICNIKCHCEKGCDGLFTAEFATILYIQFPTPPPKGGGVGNNIERFAACSDNSNQSQNWGITEFRNGFSNEI